MFRYRLYICLDKTLYILFFTTFKTYKYLEMSQGRTPIRASSTIRRRIMSGSGRPFTNTPPSWFIPACPNKENISFFS